MRRLTPHKKRTARIMRAIPLTALSGRAGVRAMKGPCGSDGGRRRYDAASPEPMYRVKTYGFAAGAPPSQPTITQRAESRQPLRSREIRLPRVHHGRVREHV